MLVFSLNSFYNLTVNKKSHCFIVPLLTSHSQNTYLISFLLVLQNVVYIFKLEKLKHKEPWVVCFSWLSIVLQTRRLWFQFPVRGHDQVEGSVLGRSTYERYPMSFSHINVSIPLFLPPFSSLKLISMLLAED